MRAAPDGCRGTSVASQTRMGGMLQYKVYTSTVLNADKSESFLERQAECAFQIATGVGGSCAGQDPTWAEIIRRSRVFAPGEPLLAPPPAEEG